MNGPLPLQLDLGHIMLEQKDLRELHLQGHMLSGFVTTAYLNILACQHHHVGVQRVGDTFFQYLTECHKNHGALGGFSAFITGLSKWEYGDHTCWMDTYLPAFKLLYSLDSLKESALPRKVIPKK